MFVCFFNVFSMFFKIKTVLTLQTRIVYLQYSLSHILLLIRLEKCTHVVYVRTLGVDKMCNLFFK